MVNKYKLTQEIRQFIIVKKQGSPELSCRGLIPLVKEHFQVNLSKSLINSVIKEHNLSNPKGRRRVGQPVKLLVSEVVKPVVETQILEVQRASQKAEFMENGGLFFLKAADLKLNLTFRLAEVFLTHLSNVSVLLLQGMIEALIYAPLFKDLSSLTTLLGKETSQEDLLRYTQQLASIPLSQPQLKEVLLKLGIKYNINEINELCKQCLLRLNSYIVGFFPPEFQFLDFLTMQKRFYVLPAKVEKEKGLLNIQLFYPPGFPWLNDIIWLEGFSYATNKLNESRILTQDSEQIWFNPLPKFLPENASFFDITFT